MTAKRPQRRRTYAGVLAVALVFGAVFLPAEPARADKNCGGTSIGLIPLPELATGSYLGHQGGLYPGGSNEMPPEHLQLGLTLATEVVPRNADGEPARDGLIGVMSVGVSNTRIEFARFREMSSADPRVSSQLVFVNGAQGSRGLETWAAGPTSPVWRSLEAELEQAGVSAGQVQVVWIKLPSEARGTTDLALADAENDQMTQVINQLSEKFPNLRIGYVSSRIYGGYALGQAARANLKRAPEPKAYQHGFTVKWLVEKQIEDDPGLNADTASGPVSAPWLAWGPYLWADGLTPREDGLVWECNDLDDDGIHPALSGADKVAMLLFRFLSTEPTASGWFLGSEQPATTSNLPQTTVASTSVGESSAPEGTVPATTAPIAEERRGSWVPVALLIVGGLAAVIAVRLRSVRFAERPPRHMD